VVVTVGRAVLRAGHTFVRQAGFPFWTLEIVLRGVMEVTTESGRTSVRAGHLSLIPPNTPYRERIPVRTDEVWTFFQPPLSWTPLLRWPTTSAGTFEVDVTRSPIRRDARAAMLQLHEVFARVTLNRAQFLDNALERVLLLAGLASPPQWPARRDDRIQKAIEHVSQNIGRRLSVPDLAAHAGLSPSRFAHCFREQVGMPLMRFVEARRMEEARSLLLRTNLPIKQIADALGFNTPFHFANRFRRCCGASPTTFRRQPDACDPLLPPTEPTLR
jgi:AraC family transcriptional regulator, arabinose operon regulatory protein